MGVADRADRSGVESGGNVERNEGYEPEVDTAVSGERDGLVEEGVGTGSGSDGDRHARQDVIVCWAAPTGASATGNGR